MALALLVELTLFDTRTGVVGPRTLGGYTVMGLAGAWPQWRFPGIKAVLALSPYSQPFVVRHDLSGLAAPVMYQGGTLDFGITPSIAKTEGAYALSAAPKYFVEFAAAGHLAWADIGRASTHPEITAYALGVEAKQLIDQDPDVFLILQKEAKKMGLTASADGVEEMMRNQTTVTGAHIYLARPDRDTAIHAGTRGIVDAGVEAAVRVELP